jgi:hypothetical protein
MTASQTAVGVLDLNTLHGLSRIQAVLNSYGRHDTNHGGGIWVGKPYGKGGERPGAGRG